ncbi:hypothetical protein IGI37_002120 [Enterococcus sp. AZ194]|uniref:ROK family protein n=1 Tax=Enterococcus sp. AZ194 TaxID=2774629 RepID=UPI003F29DC61
MTSKKNLIRQANIDAVTSCIFKNERMFAAEIVATTQISMVTVNVLLKELVDQTILLEHPNVQKELGRPATQYEFNYNSQKSLLFSFIEFDHQLYVDIYTINMGGTILSHKKEDFHEISPEKFQLLIAANLSDQTTIDSIAVLFPAKVANGVITSSWYEKMNDWNVEQLVKEVTEITCYFQNDAHVLTVGYSILNHIKLSETIVGVYYPQNSVPGVTIIGNSTLLEGQVSLAGEAKYLPLFIEKGSAKNSQEFIENLNYLLATYNAVIAPHRIIISIDNSMKEAVEHSLSENTYLNKQANVPIINYADNIEQSIVYGLHWMIYRGTPYDLAVY